MAESVVGTASGMRILSKIGGLRQTRQTIERHLNLAQEKRELEVAFTEYFARTGVQDVTPDMIQQAIDTYKQNRFTFPGWEGSGLGRSIAGLYVWFQPRALVVSAMSVLALAVVVGGYEGVGYANQMIHASEMKAARGKIGEDISNYKASLAKLDGELVSAQQWIAAERKNTRRTLSSTAVNGLIENVSRSNIELQGMRDDLESWGKTNIVVSQAAMDEDPTGALKKFETDVYPHIESVGGRMKILRDGIADKRARVDRLTQVDSDLQSMKAKMTSTYPTDVALKVVSIERLLAEGNDLEAKTAFDALGKSIVRAAAVGVLTQSISTLEARLEPTFQDQEGRKRFSDLVGQAKAQAAQGDQQGYSKTASAIESLALYVSTSLHFQFVNRNGVQTGFARTNDNTGNKRWYLVVEAVDATGTPFKMDIYNSETGVTEAVKLWGQEVPKNVFEKVSDDKKSDGILDDTDLGDKPAGHYTVDYRKSVLKTQVTRWSN